jgi:hypothetical protein
MLLSASLFNNQGLFRGEKVGMIALSRVYVSGIYLCLSHLNVIFDELFVPVEYDDNHHSYHHKDDLSIQEPAQSPREAGKYPGARNIRKPPEQR